MENRVYRLTQPGVIEESVEPIQGGSDLVLVHPTHLSICQADQRYYQGIRKQEILDQKLPMALIHEGIGTVIQDEIGEFIPGDVVLMVPNTPEKEDRYIAENYLRSSNFRASGSDGYMQSIVAMRRDRLVSVPSWIDCDVASFFEICSVANHAIDRFDQMAHGRREKIGVWGEGNLGYILSAIFKKRFPNSNLFLFGVVPEKMEEFYILEDWYPIDNIPANVLVDHAFECVGSKGSEIAINQIIDRTIAPEGTIAIMGVSEDPILVNTRMVLEKGLRIFGSSRSGVNDFKNILDICKEHPGIVEEFQKVIGDVVKVRTIEDMHDAFHRDQHNGSRKTIMHWEVPFETGGED